jgi:DNA repair exonuclease SbcCD ATPase subunit
MTKEILSILLSKISKNKDIISQSKYKIDLLHQKIELTRKHMNEIVSIKNSDKKEKEKFLLTLTKQNEEYSEYVKTLNNEIAILNDSIKDKIKIESTLQKLKQYEYKLNHKISILQNEIDFFHNNDECPTCQQIISDESKTTSVTEKFENKEKVIEGLSQLNEQYETLNNRMQEISVVQKKISDIQSNVIETSTKISANDSQIKQIQETLKKEIEIDNTTITDLKKYTDELQVSKNEYNELLSKKEQYDIASSLLKDSGIKTKIIKQYIPIINKLMNKYLAAMDFFVQFELDENFNEKILSRFRDEFKYDSFSEG